MSPNGTHSCFQVLERPELAYFFAGENYVGIEVTPGTMDDKLVYGPRAITSGWPRLKEAGFTTIDAVLPRTDGKNPDQAYFFSGARYCRLQVKPGTTEDVLIDGPHNISGKWPILDQIGFKTVDAVLPRPDGKEPGEVYFFCGAKYARILIKPGTTADKLIDGPHDIQGKWPGLDKAGFATVDAALPSPKGNSEVYFFCGSQYALIKVVPGTLEDTVITGPKSVASYWPVLKDNGIY